MASETNIENSVEVYTTFSKTWGDFDPRRLAYIGKKQIFDAWSEIFIMVFILSIHFYSFNVLSDSDWDIAFRKASWDIRLVVLSLQVMNVLAFNYVKPQYSRE